MRRLGSKLFITRFGMFFSVSAWLTLTRVCCKDSSGFVVGGISVQSGVRVCDHNVVVNFFFFY